MIVKIRKSKAEGKIVAPPSKSMAHRALICAALSEKSRISNLAFSKDIEATVNALKCLGADAYINGTNATLGLLDAFNIKDGCEVYANESGSTLRFLIPLCMLSDTKITIKGAPRLFERPLSVYEQIAERDGIAFNKIEDGVEIKGKLRGGEYTVRGDISSQFISGLLFALPLLSCDSSIKILGDFESESYVNLTVDALKTFGIDIKREKNTYYITGNQRYRSCDLTVEADESNSAFLSAFNMLWGNVEVLGQNPDTLQGDKIYKTWFKALKEGQTSFDLKDCPDLAPCMFALAAVYGRITFTSTARLRLKESDRAEAMKAELSKFKVETEIFDNSVIVHGGKITAPTESLCSHNDHRIVMALSLLLTLVGGEIEGAEAVSKSYPDFFSVLKTLKVGLEIYDNK